MQTILKNASFTLVFKFHDNFKKILSKLFFNLKKVLTYLLIFIFYQNKTTQYKEYENKK